MSEKPPVQKLGPNQYCNPDISAEQTHRIGQVIVSWSKLEAAMEDTIWMFLDVDDETGKIITKRLSTDVKIQLVRTLGPFHISDEALLNGFNETIKYAEELKGHRNFIAHGVWGTLMPDNTPVALALKPKSEIGEVISETFSPERMEGIADGIRLMHKRFVDLPEQLGKPRRVPHESPRP